MVYYSERNHALISLDNSKASCLSKDFQKVDKATLVSPSKVNARQMSSHGPRGALSLYEGKACCDWFSREGPLLLLSVIRRVIDSGDKNYVMLSPDWLNRAYPGMWAVLPKEMQQDPANLT